MAVNLAPGSYNLYCIGQWGQDTYDYDLTFFGKQTVNFKRVYYHNFPNIIAEAFTE